MYLWKYPYGLAEPRYQDLILKKSDQYEITREFFFGGEI